MEHPERAVVVYREYVPHPALRPYVRTLFSFTRVDDTPARTRTITREERFAPGESFCSPMLADGTASIVFELGASFRADGVWHETSAEPRGNVIGAMSRVGVVDMGQRPAMIGAYLQPACLGSFARVAAHELTDRVVPVADAWGTPASELAVQLEEVEEEARVERIEAELLRRLARARVPNSSVDVGGLASYVVRSEGRVSVDALAHAAGVSRQHLARLFKDTVGVSPKLFARLARFRAALANAGTCDAQWSRVAATLGYADQSHMIAEFREFSSLTPRQLGDDRLFHPFIRKADKAARPRSR